MKPKTYVILEMAIEEGVKQGWHRAHKYVENPDQENTKEHIVDAVISAIHQYFTFDENEYV